MHSHFGLLCRTCEQEEPSIAHVKAAEQLHSAQKFSDIQLKAHGLRIISLKLESQIDLLYTNTANGGSCEGFKCFWYWLQAKVS